MQLIRFIILFHNKMSTESRDSYMRYVM